MALPALNPIAARIYEEVLPIAYDDEAADYFLAHMIEAWTRPMLILEQLTRDTDDGPGWSAVFDPERIVEFDPRYVTLFLNWLSMVVGSPPRPGETVDQARLRIEGMTGLRRGSAQAMRAAATRYLVSIDPDRAPYVIFNERQGGNAWRIAIRTLTDETPDPDLVEAALREQKPVGIVLTYDTIDGITYDTITAAYDTYADVLAAYPDYGHMVVDLPA